MYIICYTPADDPNDTRYTTCDILYEKDGVFDISRYETENPDINITAVFSDKTNIIRTASSEKQDFISIPCPFPKMRLTVRRI